jgi:3-oxoacyl-[acyl-carrier-protein] synthase II
MTSPSPSSSVPAGSPQTTPPLPLPPPGAPMAVTGIGAVCGCGWGLEALWRGVCSGQAAIGDFDRFDHQRHRTHLASPVPPPPAGLLHEVEVALRHRVHLAAPRISAADRYALAATVEALRTAGLLAALPDSGQSASRLRIGVFFGTSTAGMYEAELVFAHLVSRGTMPRLSALASQPMNAPGDLVARAVGATGPVLTTSSACTSGALAIAAALDALRAGEVDVAIAGGSDELCQLTYAGFNALRAVDPQASRPFRADRQGLTLGEGAGVLVLEAPDAATARGAEVLALLRGAGSTCDAEHMTAPAQGGTGAARAIAEALADAACAPAAIDFVNAHGTGTPLNDAAEAAAFASTFGAAMSQLPVTSTKGVVGHLLGAAGALEAVVTIACLRAAEVHPTPGAGEADPALGVHLVRERPLPVPGARTALSTSLAFGGSNAALVFGLPPAHAAGDPR